MTRKRYEVQQADGSPPKWTRAAGGIYLRADLAICHAKRLAIAGRSRIEVFDDTCNRFLKVMIEFRP